MMNVEHTHTAQHEQWSALHDGQLSHEQALALVRASLHDEQLMLQWRSMSAIGQAMREESGAYAWHQPRSSLAQAASRFDASLVPVPQPAANDSRWKMVAGVAALAAVGSMVWGLLGAGSGVPQGAVLAGNTGAGSATLVNTSPVRVVGLGNGATGAPAAPAATAGAEATMIRNPRLDEFLAAHKQFGGVSALQQPAGSLRSVSVSVGQR
jgi:sigma-E factor negative regulatory protein RseA